MHVDDKDLVPTLSAQVDATLLEAAVYARVNTPLGPARWLGPLGNYLVARPVARVAAHRAEERTELPLDAAVVLGITADALHVWQADPMLSQVRDHLGSVPRAEIAGVTTDGAAKSWWSVTITMRGGEAVELQARGDVSGFVAAAGGGA